jgi:hypothetical protein
MKLTTHLPSAAKVKNERNYKSVPHAGLHGMDWDNLTFTFYVVQKLLMLL